MITSAAAHPVPPYLETEEGGGRERERADGSCKVHSSSV